jgi:hypothetical protein
MPRVSGPPPLWPDTLPNPQSDSFAVTGPPRVEVADVLFGITRLAVKARTAPMTYNFEVILSRAEMEIFEGWYRDVIENHDGEFYARWIGGSRIVAFASNYTLGPFGAGWILQCTAIRTRIDHEACDAFISSVFQNIYRADLAAVDIYEADLTSADLYQDDFSLSLIVDNEC